MADGRRSAKAGREGKMVCQSAAQNTVMRKGRNICANLQRGGGRLGVDTAGLELTWGMGGGGGGSLQCSML